MDDEPSPPRDTDEPDEFDLPDTVLPDEVVTFVESRGTVVVPPEARASLVVRDVVASAIGKIDADKVLEEVVRVEAVDLFYRPVYAFRYRRAGKEAIGEFDALTGEVHTGGATLEGHFGKGSMGRKVAAVMEYVAACDGEGIITDIENMGKAIVGEAGTRIVRG